MNVGLMGYADAALYKDYNWGSIKGMSFPVRPIDAEAADVISGYTGVDNLLDPDPLTPVRSFLADVVDEWEPNGYTPLVGCCSCTAPPPYTPQKRPLIRLRSFPYFHDNGSTTITGSRLY